MCVSELKPMFNVLPDEESLAYINPLAKPVQYVMYVHIGLDSQTVAFEAPRWALARRCHQRGLRVLVPMGRG